MSAFGFSPNGSSPVTLGLNFADINIQKQIAELINTALNYIIHKNGRWSLAHENAKIPFENPAIVSHTLSKKDVAALKKAGLTLLNTDDEPRIGNFYFIGLEEAFTLLNKLGHLTTTLTKLTPASPPAKKLDGESKSAVKQKDAQVDELKRNIKNRLTEMTGTCARLQDQKSDLTDLEIKAIIEAQQLITDFHEDMSKSDLHLFKGRITKQAQLLHKIITRLKTKDRELNKYLDAAKEAAESITNINADLGIIALRCEEVKSLDPVAMYVIEKQIFPKLELVKRHVDSFRENFPDEKSNISTNIQRLQSIINDKNKIYAILRNANNFLDETIAVSRIHDSPIRALAPSISPARAAPRIMGVNQVKSPPPAVLSI